jgi:hypothetical protein
VSASGSRGRRGEPSPRPLRGTTRAESTRARRERRSWRTRKLGMVFAGMPIVVVSAVGFAMASPFHHHPPSSTGAACTTAVATTTSAAAAGKGDRDHGSGSGSETKGASYHEGSSYSKYGGTASASASGTGTTTASASAAGSASAAAGTGTAAASTSAAAGTGTASAAAATSSAAAACPTKSATAAATTPAAAATPNPNCTLIVPANPLSAKGLATPYQLVATNAAMGPCNEANINQSAFVQASVYNQATGALSVYNPLVIDKGTKAAAAPVVPALPAHAVVGIWFGFNATNLTLQDANGSLAAGKCVNGMGNGDVFGQFAYCNAPAFFSAVNAGIKAHMVKVPNPGTAIDGQPCLTTRNFALIDQDQSDNVTSAYLATANGTLAVKTAANVAKLAGAVTIANPSDNALLDVFVDPALGCKPWTAPNLGDANNPATSLGLDEIQANAFAANPQALVPVNDPMALVNAAVSNGKTNLYRAGVDQPALPAGQTAATYCGDMDSIQAVRLQQDVNLLIKQTTPSAAAASNLFTFLGMRLQQSFTNLNCQNFGLKNPVTALGTNGQGVIVSVVFAQATNAVTAGAGNPAEKCVTMAAAAQAACALAAVGMPTNPASASAMASASPTPTSTATPRPKGDMHHGSKHHW